MNNRKRTAGRRIQEIQVPKKITVKGKDDKPILIDNPDKRKTKYVRHLPIKFTT